MPSPDSLKNLRAAINEIELALLREKDKQVMLMSTCRIAVEKAGFVLAWIGIFDESLGRVRIHAHAGADPNTLAALDGIIASAPPSGCGFTGLALLSGQHGVCNDIATDPLAAPWRSAALQRNYHSMAALPLKMNGAWMGTFNLYSRETAYFDTEQLRLLDELTRDIGLALSRRAS